MSHYVRFTRHTVTGETRATCTCGWSSCADRETVKITAEHHLAKDEPAKLPRAETLGFVSGLAKLDN